MNSKIKSKMEKGKKYIIVLLTLLLVSASFNICYAETESKEEKMNEPRISERELLTVPSFIQDNDSYCGPASLEMTLKYLGINKNQRTLAQESGTVVRGSKEHLVDGKKPGTVVYRVAQCLNDNLPGTPYCYATLSQRSLQDGIVDSIRNNYPVICHTNPYVLPNYDGPDRNQGHYVVVTGYILQTTGTGVNITLHYNDPNNQANIGGKYSTPLILMEEAIAANSGYYICKNW